jgi:hypothetical protein
MLFSHSTPDSNLHLTLMGEPILRVHEKGSERSFKLVGVQLDECLNWKHHVNHVNRKVAGAMSLIRKAKHFLPTYIRLPTIIQSYSTLPPQLLQQHLGRSVSFYP